MLYNPQLETFINVADAGSFSKAAEIAFISPTAVIKQINILEAELGVQLFVRTHRGISLTESGKSLYNDAKYMIQYAEDTVKRATSTHVNTSNVVRIGTSPMSPGQFLVDLWPQIHEQCQEIKFKLVTYENTPKNAVEILANMGQNIDVVAGFFDEEFLQERRCAALELSKEPVRCGVPVTHRLAAKDSLKIEDLYGEKLMLNTRIWNICLRALRKDLAENHSEINIVDFDFYDVNIFNRCENENSVLMTFDVWHNVHPLLKILPMEWDYTVPFGLLHSPAPSQTMCKFLDAVQAVLDV